MSHILNVYCSGPMNSLDDYYKLASYLEYEDSIKLCIPRQVDCDYHSYVFSDLIVLENVDVLVVHIPTPSIGTCCELGYFKAIKPFSPVIGYKCIEHGWLKHLLNFHFDDIKSVAQVLDSIYESYSR